MAKRIKKSVHGIPEGKFSWRIGRTKTGFKFIEAYNLSGKFAYCDASFGDGYGIIDGEYKDVTSMNTEVKMLQDALSRPIIDLRRYEK